LYLILYLLTAYTYIYYTAVRVHYLLILYFINCRRCDICVLDTWHC